MQQVLDCATGTGALLEMNHVISMRIYFNFCLHKSALNTSKIKLNYDESIIDPYSRELPVIDSLAINVELMMLRAINWN